MPSIPKRALPFLAILAVLALACGGADPGAGPGDDPPVDPPPEDPPPVDPPPFRPVVDLRADVNRDGVADLSDPSDDAGEEIWTPAAGAIVLANLDDDAERCEVSFLDGPETSDDALAACNDAADEVVNGPEDLLDLAPLRVAAWPAAPDDAVATLRVLPPADGKVRLFRRSAGGDHALLASPALALGDLRAGLELALEVTDVVRDRAAWDGLVDVVLRVERRGAPATAVEDRVRLRVAPLVLSSHAEPAEALFVSEPAPDDGAGLAFRDAIAGVADAAGVAGGLVPLSAAPWRDRWIQDFFEAGWAEMPGRDGPHRMRVVLRSPFVEADGAVWSPLRRASRTAYLLRGRDAAVVQQYRRDGLLENRTLDSMGNTEVVPPHAHAGVAYPFGRIVRGRTATFFPDPSFAELLDAQGVQAPIDLDTSWLFVGHVDETLAFVPSSTAPRGWVAVVADPPLARAVLEDLAAAGQGDARLLAGLRDRYGNPVERSVAQVLGDGALAAANATATARIAAQLAVLREEVGLAEEEIVRVPVLFTERLPGRLQAWTGNVANLLAPVAGVVAAPAPHGPVVGGEDALGAAVEAALAPHGVRVEWVDAWRYLHVFVGEVHCGTNAVRAPPLTPWWGGAAGGP